jgi:undecaprenyl-diphosphatase
MSLLKALLLGLVQGLTEFLPVSSSGHLVLVNSFLNVDTGSIAFEVAVHLGTLLAVLVYFRHDLASLVSDLFRGGPFRRVAWMLIAGTIPTAIIGFAFQDTFKALFAAPRYASAGLLFTSVILFAAERMSREGRPLTGVRIIDALLIGTFQGLAIVPGISRSGSTISAGLFTGLGRDAAARFSFLLSIPAILGAGILEIPEFTSMGQEMVLPAVVGVFASTLSGYAAIGILMRVLKAGKLYVFSAYTAVVGVAGLLFLPA